MRWLLAALSTSVGRKFVMGLTGLFLCGFLVIHLAGNLLLFAGPEKYNAYADALHKQEKFLLLAEILLYGALLFHLYLAFRLSLDNWRARQVSYRESRSKIQNRTASAWIAPERWMLFSGLGIMVFTVVHLADFKFEWGFNDMLSELQPYDKAEVILQDFLRAVIYFVGSLFVGIHVAHGFASAFQSLGLNHPKYNGLIRGLSIAFAWIVAIGFASFPLVWGIGGPDAAREKIEQVAPVDVTPIDVPLAPEDH